MFFRKSFASTTVAVLLGAAASSNLAPRQAYGASPLSTGKSSYPTPFAHDGTNSVLYRAGYTWPAPDDNIALSVNGDGTPKGFQDLNVWNAPHAAGGFAAYRRSDGVTSIVYRGLLDNIIHALIYSPSVKQWVRDYNFPGGTPTAAGDPVAFVQAYPTVNTVVYRTSNNHIEALYSTDGVNWLTHDLFEGTPAPDAAGDPAAYMTSYSDSAVLYRDFSGIIQELWLVPWGSSWQYAPLFRPGACPRAAGSPAGYVRSDGVNAVVYRGYDDSDIHELYFDGIWKCEDLSLRTGAPPALGDPAAYVRSDNVSSVVYRALKPTGQVHIQEIYGILPPPPPPRLPVAPLALNWGTADLSGMTGGLDAAGDPAPYILSFDGNSLAQANAVVYRDVSGNLQELYLSWGAANWVRYLLTPSGAPPANQ